MLCSQRAVCAGSSRVRLDAHAHLLLPSHLGRSAGFTTGQAHFYYAEVSADPDDPMATNFICFALGFGFC